MLTVMTHKFTFQFQTHFQGKRNGSVSILLWCTLATAADFAASAAAVTRCSGAKYPANVTTFLENSWTGFF
jgi:hypothetical protein